MSTKEDAIELIIAAVCEGMREHDHENMKESGRSFRTLIDDETEEAEHGWIFQCPATGYTREGTREPLIGGGLAVAFNRKTGKRQKFYPRSAIAFFCVENFKRTGDIYKGCADNSLLIMHSAFEDAETEKPNVVLEIQNILMELFVTRAGLSAETARQLVKSIFTQSAGRLFLDALSQADAEYCASEIETLNELMVEHDYYATSMETITYAQAKA